MCVQTMAPPMQNILQRLQVPNYIQVILFSNQTILEEAVENWPTCDCFIAFFSAGFPLDKAHQYVKLRKPLVINDLEMQYLLMDRYYTPFLPLPLPLNGACIVELHFCHV